MSNPELFMKVLRVGRRPAARTCDEIAARYGWTAFEVGAASRRLIAEGLIEKTVQKSTPIYTPTAKGRLWMEANGLTEGPLQGSPVSRLGRDGKTRDAGQAAKKRGSGDV